MLYSPKARAIKEGIRIYNITRVENKYTRKKFGDNIDLIYKEARDYFKSGSTSLLLWNITIDLPLCYKRQDNKLQAIQW